MTSYIPEMYTNPEGVYMAQTYSVLRPTHFIFFFTLDMFIMRIQLFSIVNK